MSIDVLFDQIGTYLLALAAASTRITRQTVRNVPFFVVATTAKIVTKATLDVLSEVQAKDLLVVVPAQHPKGLLIADGQFGWTVLQESLISKGMNSDAFDVDEGDLTGDEEEEESCEMGRVRCHRIDPKASFGVILEGKDPSELTQAWKAYELSEENAMVENIYSEVQSDEY